MSQREIPNYFDIDVSPSVNANLQNQLIKRAKNVENEKNQQTIDTHLQQISEQENRENEHYLETRVRELEIENQQLKVRLANAEEDFELMDARYKKVCVKLENYRAFRQDLLASSKENQQILYSHEGLDANHVASLNRIAVTKSKDQAFVGTSLIAVHDGDENILKTMSINPIAGCNLLKPDKKQAIQRLFVERLNDCCANIEEVRKRNDRLNNLLSRALSQFRNNAKKN